MQPPKTINVVDFHDGGFVAETPSGRRRADGYQSTNTLWRPGAVLKKGTTGTLTSFNERSFYQNNNDVTRAKYRIPGYRYPAIVWFDNPTGRRISGVSFISPEDVEPWRRGGKRRHARGTARTKPNYARDYNDLQKALANLKKTMTK